MDCRIGDLRYKEVINVNTGLRLGFVSDAVFDLKTGQMRALVVPGAYKVMGVFGRSEDYVIGWESIRRIGDDIILVEDCRLEQRDKKSKKWPGSQGRCRPEGEK